MATPFSHDHVFTHVEELRHGKPAHCLRYKPVGSYAKYAILLALSCLCAVSARADEHPSLAWNCWADEQGSSMVSCIHERAQLPKTALDDTDSELETHVLDQIREKTRSGEAAKLGGLEWKNIEVVHKGAKWTINVYSYRIAALRDESWLTKLATMALCPLNIPCTVTIHKPVQQATQDIK